MEKTNGIDQSRSVISNANSPSFDATNIALNPPILQLKSQDKSPDKDVSSELNYANAPFQFAAADPGLPSIQNRTSITPFQLKTIEANSESENKEAISEVQPYQLAAEGSESPSENPSSNSGEIPPNNTGLPTQLKSGVESLSGYSLDDVKVHYNSNKPAQLKAHAYAQGTDIHLGSGQEKHLPHEAWHVVQQKQGRVQATTQLKGIGINDDAGLEKEADVMGAKAASIQLKETDKNQSSRSNSSPTGIFQLEAKEVKDEKKLLEALQKFYYTYAVITEDSPELDDFGEFDEFSDFIEYQAITHIRKIHKYKGSSTYLENLPDFTVLDNKDLKESIEDYFEHHQDKLNIASSELEKKYSSSSSSNNWGKKVNENKGFQEMDVSSQSAEAKLTENLLKAKDSFKSLEKISDYISLLNPEELTEEAKEGYMASIERVFNSNMTRKFYLLSMLKEDNGSFFGEPSKTAQLLMASGTLQKKLVSPNLNRMMDLMEGSEMSTFSELVNDEIYNALNSSMKITENTNEKRDAKMRYLKKGLGNIKNENEKAKTNVQETEEEKFARIDDKRIEAELLMRTHSMKALTMKSINQTISKNDAIAHLTSWSEHLKDDEKDALKLRNNSNSFFIFLNRLLSEEKITYVMMAIDGNNLVEDENEKKLSAEAFIAFINSKKEGKRPLNKIESFLENINSLNHTEKLKVLISFHPDLNISQATLTSDLTERNIAVEALKVKLSKIGIRWAKLRLLSNAFKFAATNIPVNPQSGLAEVYSIINRPAKVVEKNKLRTLIVQLTTPELVQLRSDQDFVATFIHLRQKYSNSQALSIIARFLKFENLPNQTDLDQVDDEVDDKELHMTKVQTEVLELDPDFWGLKISQAFKTERKIASNKNKVLSLMTQAYYAGQRAVTKSPDLFDDVKSFTSMVYNSIPFKDEMEKKRGLENGLNSLLKGTPISIQDKLETATYAKLSPKRVKGIGMKVSSIEQIIEDSSGYELLMELTDFSEAMLNAESLSEDQKTSFLISYIPTIKGSFLNKLDKELPLDERSSLHQLALFKIATALEEDTAFKALIGRIGVKHLDLRGEMLKNLGLLNREAMIDTGWQLKYFSTKGAIRKEAKNKVVVRLRKAKRGVVKHETSPEVDSDIELGKIKTNLSDAREDFEDGTAIFEEAKEKAVDRVMFALSITLGLITTAVTLGTAAPLIAAGFTAVAAQYMISLSATLGASIIKQIAHKALVGAAHNDKEALYNIAKDVSLAAATVAAGQTSGALQGIDGNALEAISETNEGAHRFLNNLAQVSPVEVAYRTFVETALENFTTSEAAKRTSLDWRFAVRYIRGSLLDAILKTTFDSMTASISDESGAYCAATKAPIAMDISSDALQAGIDSGSIIEFIPHTLNAGQVLAILFGESIITSQNFSVAEQDSVVGELIDAVIGKLIPFEEDEIEQDSSKSKNSGTPIHIDTLRTIPPHFIIESSFNTAMLHEFFTKKPEFADQVPFDKISTRKVKEYIQEFFNAYNYDKEDLKSIFGDSYVVYINELEGINHLL